jgi:poly-gamma-glutamate synthesis protein (capsule biosynthesis protein)
MMTKINFMGDVMFGELLETYRRGLIATLDRTGADPFEFVRPALDEGDLNVINLECVLSDRSILARPFGEILIAPERYLRFLTDNRINVVTTANNHALDHGEDALKTSVELLEAHGIAVMGYRPGRYFQSEPVVREAGGRSIGFLGYNISNFPDDDKKRQVDRIRAAVSSARSGVDTLVVSMHWGEEYTNIPPGYVVAFGREIIEAGCDILHGHHSHQIQGVALLEGALFAPSLGNFVFDQLVPQNRITAVLRVALGDGGISYEYLPYFMNSRFQPEPSPRHGAYLEELHGLLAQSLEPGGAGKYAARIASRVRDGHRRNRIRMRAKMLGHFWDYARYWREIRNFRRSTAKMFSVIDCEDSLPD